MGAHVEISLLGPIGFSINGMPLAKLRSRKSLWLGAYLVLAGGRATPRERIAHDFWPDSDTTTALSNLRAVVSDLRKALGTEKDRLRVEERNSLAFDVDGIVVDVLRFDRAFADGNFGLAVELYRGELLEGCREDWVVQERQVRLDRAVNAYLALADRAIEDKQFDTAIQNYREAGRLEPLRDEGIVGLMTVFAERGHFAEATHTYRAFADRLRREIGLSPSGRVSDLYLQVRNGKWKRKDTKTSRNEEAFTEQPGSVPHALTEMVGREDELAEISSILRQYRLVTLTGVGGVGKTRLATQVAQDLQSEFSDGVFFLPLESLTSEDQIVRSLSSSLGIREEAGVPFSASFATRHRSKKMLLVLDNCEHLIAQCVQLASELLNSCGELRVLLTSRHGLAAAGERIFTVPGLTVPIPEQLPTNGSTRVRVAQSYEGVALFAARAKAASRDFEITAGNAHLVSRICAELEGIPLAIELAAAQAGSMALEAIADQLSDMVGLLAKPQLAAQPRHQTMRATLDWSYKLLSSAEKSLLGRLSEFVNGWSLEAAVAVSSRAPSQSQTIALLQSLVAKSLVVFEVSKGRYRLLEPVRVYASEQVSESVKKETKELHQRWFLKFSEEAEAGLASRQLPLWTARISQDHGNILKAATWLEPETIANAEQQIAGNLWRYWYIQGEYEFGYRFLGAAVNRGSTETSAGLKCLLGLGRFALSLNRCAEAKTIASKGAELAKTMGDLVRFAYFLNVLGGVALAEGDEAAEGLYEESLRIRLEISDFPGAAVSTCNLGNMANQKGRFDLARSLYLRGFALAERANDPHAEAFLHLNAGDNEEVAGNFEVAREHYEKCLEFHQMIGSQFGTALSLSCLGSLKRKQSEHEGARWMYERALQIFRSQGELRNQALMLHELATTSIAAADSNTARQLNDECLGILRSFDASKEYALALRMRAELARSRGDLDGAQAAFLECIDCLQSLGEDGMVNQARADFAQLRAQDL